MFETMYRYSRVLVRHLDGPAAEERDRFVTHVAAAGATRESLLHLASELLLVAQRLDVSGTRTITPQEIASAADRWVRHQRRHGHISTARYSHQRFVQVATDWLRFLGRLESPPVTRGTGADLVDEFAAGMRLERGLSPKTVYNRCWHVQAFLTWLDEQHGSAGAATLEDVDAFLTMRGAQEWCRVSIATAATALRSFFNHMAATGRCSDRLAAGIEGPRLFKRLPTAIRLPYSRHRPGASVPTQGPGHRVCERRRRVAPSRARLVLPYRSKPPRAKLICLIHSSSIC